jgi:hypothetical protein
MAKEEYGRDPAKLEFRVLLMGGAAPNADTLKRYRDAGITRVVVAAAGFEWRWNQGGTRAGRCRRNGGWAALGDCNNRDGI